MAGRFAPPPDVQANTRRRLLVLRTSHRRIWHGASHHRHMRALTCHAIIPPATSLFVSATATTALHTSKATSSFCKRRYALVLLRTAHCLLRLIHVCRSQKRPCSGMFASYAHRYQSRVRSTLQPRPNPPLVQILFYYCPCFVLSARCLYPLTERYVAELAMHTSAVNWPGQIG